MEIYQGTTSLKEFKQMMNITLYQGVSEAITQLVYIKKSQNSVFVKIVNIQILIMNYTS